MEYGDVVGRLAPCGLDCSRCADYENGEIRQKSSRLIQLLGGYGRMAKLKVKMNPAFENFAQFEEILNSFSKASCGGCRSDNTRCPVVCPARTCHREKGVDFCFQCGEYPCDKQFFPGLKDRWKQKNDRMKEIGVVEFYNEQLSEPRY